MSRQQKFNNNIFYFFVFVFICSSLLIAWIFSPFINAIVFAFLITSFFAPIYKKLLLKFSNEKYASFTTCLIVFLLLFFPAVSLVGVLSKEAFDLYMMGKNAVLGQELGTILNKYNYFFERVNLLLSKFGFSLDLKDLLQELSNLVKFTGKFLFERFSSIASNTFGFFLQFFLTILISYFLFIDGYKLKDFILDLSPLPNEQDAKLVQKFENMTRAVLLVNGLGGIIQGILGGFVFFFLGLQSPFLWGTIMGLLAFLPILGIGLVLIPASLILLLQAKIKTAIFLFLFYFVLSMGIEYFLKPKLVSNKVEVNTMLFLLSILGGLNIFGILGIIYGPIILSAFITLSEIYKASYQHIAQQDEELFL